MANEVLIDKIVDPKVSEQLKTTEQQLTAIIDKIELINKAGLKPGGDGAKTIKEATTAMEEQARTEAKLNALKEDGVKKSLQLKQQLQEETKLRKLKAQATNEEISGYDRLQAKVSLLAKKAKDLAVTKGMEAEATKRAFEQHNKYEQRLRAVDEAMNNHKRNVGNYEGAVVGLRTQIRALTQTLGQMELQGKNDSNQYKAMVMQLGKLKDAMGDVSARSKFFADDQRYVTGITQALQGMIGAYSAYVAVMGLVGDEDEELQKNMAKMMQLMVLMQGITQVSTALNKDNAAMVMFQVGIDKVKELFTKKNTAATVVNTVATKAETAAVETNTAAKWANRGVIGLIIVGIAALAYGIYKLVKVFKDKEEAQIRDNMLSEEQIEQIKKLNEVRLKQIENIQAEKINVDVLFGALKNLNTSGAARASIIKQINDQYGTYLPNLLTEKSSAEDIAAAYDLIVKSMKNKIAMEIAIETAKDKMKSGVKMQDDLMTLRLQQKALKDYLVVYKDYLAEMQSGAEMPTVPFILGELDPTQETLDNITGKINNLTGSIQSNQKSIDNDVKSAATLAAAMITYEHQTDKATKATKKNNDAHVEQYNLWLENQKALRDSIFVVDKMANSTEFLKATNKELPKVLGESIAFLKQYEEAIDGINDNWAMMSDAERLDKIRSWADKVSDVLSDVINIISDFQQNAVESALSGVQQSFDDTANGYKSMLDNQIISQEEYNQRMEMLNKEKDAKEKKLRHDAFEDARKLAIANAIINGVQATLAAYSSGAATPLIGPATGGLYAGIAAAFAAIQVALIASQANPYWTGRVGGPDEMAIVGDRKGFEYISTASGDLYKTPNVATLTHLRAGDSVIPHDLSVQLDKYVGMPNVSNVTKVNQSVAGNIEVLSELRKLNRKPTANISIDQHGFKILVGSANQWSKHINNHVKI